MKPVTFLTALAMTIAGLPVFCQSGVDSRVYALPSISYESKKPILPPFVIPGGEGLVFPPNTTIYPATKKAVEAQWHGSITGYSTCSIYSAFVQSQVWSPNLRFGVNNCVGCSETLPDKSGSTTFSTKSKVRNSISKGFVTSYADTPWTWCNVDKDYVLAVTNEGSIITTNPAEVDTKKNRAGNITEAEIVKMRGLWLIDPRTGKRQTLREDLIKDGTGKDPQLMMSADEKTMFVLTSRQSAEQIEGSFMDIATGKKTILPWVNSLKATQMGRQLLLATNGKDKAIVYRVSDGAKLLEHVSQDSVVEDFYLAENDDLYFYNGKSGDVAIFKMSGNEMLMSKQITLQQDGVKSSAQPYFFRVLKDYVALVPSSTPGMSRWDDGYDLMWGVSRQYAYPVFFDLKSGKPTSFVSPYLLMRPTASEVLAQRKQRCSDMKQQMSWKVGSLLCRKKTSTSGSALVLKGVDCDRTAYQLASVNGSTSYYEYNLFDYELCSEPGGFTVCSKCKGVPHSRTEETVADDRWEQVNFNIYVRSPNKKRTQYTEFHCDLCKGTGYLKK
ncbi:MAG: hypothetical protein V4722_28705 [Bacteroidota bacterium]